MENQSKTFKFYLDFNDLDDVESSVLLGLKSLETNNAKFVRVSSPEAEVDLYFGYEVEDWTIKINQFQPRFWIDIRQTDRLSRAFELVKEFIGNFSEFQETFESFNSVDQGNKLFENFLNSAPSLNTTVKDRFRVVCNELITNALYNAPVDENKKFVYRDLARRELPREFENSSSIKFVDDVDFVEVLIIDQFGSLSFDRLMQFISTPVPNELKKIGGAGIGMVMTLKNCHEMVIHVKQWQRTAIRCRVYKTVKNKDFHTKNKIFYFKED